MRALIFFLLSLVIANGTSRASEPADVLLITVDTLRADYLSVYGFPDETSPNIASLAEQGVVFDRAIAGSAATVPSHASIFTSRYVREHSVGFSNGGSALVGNTTLAEAFHEAGYSTAAFVSNAVLKRPSGLDAGFDHYDDDLPDYEPNRKVPERLAQNTTDRALAWMDRDRTRPSFMWVHYQDPHGPYTPPRELEARFRVAPDRFEKKLPVQDNNLGMDGIPAYQAIRGLERPSEYRGRYAGEIFHADASIGRLVEAVRGRNPNAVILLTSDHGESFGENRRYLVHGYTTTPDVAHVPFIVSAPGVAPGRRSDVVSHVDVLPTLLELAGIPLPAEVSGDALGPLLREGVPLRRRWVYCDIGRELSAYRDGEFFRLLGVEGAWEPDREPISPLWVRHEWSQDGWARAAGGDRDPAILEYSATAAPMHPIELDAKTREMLKSLGYVVD